MFEEGSIIKVRSLSIGFYQFSKDQGISYLKYVDQVPRNTILNVIDACFIDKCWYYFVVYEVNGEISKGYISAESFCVIT